MNEEAENTETTNTKQEARSSRKPNKSKANGFNIGGLILLLLVAGLGYYFIYLKKPLPELVGKTIAPVRAFIAEKMKAFPKITPPSAPSAKPTDKKAPQTAPPFKAAEKGFQFPFNFPWFQNKNEAPKPTPPKNKVQLSPSSAKDEVSKSSLVLNQDSKPAPRPKAASKNSTASKDFEFVNGIERKAPQPELQANGSLSAPKPIRRKEGAAGNGNLESTFTELLGVSQDSFNETRYSAADSTPRNVLPSLTLEGETTYLSPDKARAMAQRLLKSLSGTKAASYERINAYDEGGSSVFSIQAQNGQEYYLSYKPKNTLTRTSWKLDVYGDYN